ncbi:hypothetical protein DdX_03110 [Ditylenchus destructor]|uniref:Uncharacterized protein n=1 Tax=Ditylenchus destructor TaxID=166010 RepID=A0AAD4R6L7_9BILA|nr:hypothetical protein DdX_03110 [Ditylenchus destructor]
MPACPQPPYIGTKDSTTATARTESRQISRQKQFFLGGERPPLTANVRKTAAHRSHQPTHIGQWQLFNTAIAFGDLLAVG